MSDIRNKLLLEDGMREIRVPLWVLLRLEDTLRIDYNIALESKSESCQDRNVKQCLNCVRKLIKGDELTGNERLEKLVQL